MKIEDIEINEKYWIRLNNKNIHDIVKHIDINKVDIFGNWYYASYIFRTEEEMDVYYFNEYSKVIYDAINNLNVKIEQRKDELKQFRKQFKIEKYLKTNPELFI